MAPGNAQPTTRIAYGEDPSQFADLWMPPSAGRVVPVVVLLHGGFWRPIYGLDLMEPLAGDLVGRGYAVWNIEYRRVGHEGGGWPGTLTDVAAALDQLVMANADDGLDHRLALDDITYVGHSAGGHLALWAAGRDQIPAGQAGGDPVVMPSLAIGQGPVADLLAAERDGVGNGAVRDFLGPADEFPERYEIATPRIGRGVRVAVVRGGDDIVVPAAYTVPVYDSPVKIVDVPGDDHFDLIDPLSQSWAAVLELMGCSADSSP